MSVTVHVDFSNGATKTITNIGLGTNNSVTGVFDAAATMLPGFSYEFEADFVDRGGREVGRVVSVDGVGSAEHQVWGVWVNDRAVSDLRRVVDQSFTPIGGVKVEDGDTNTLKLMRSD